MTGSPDAGVDPVRAVVVSGSGADARTLADELAAHGGVAVESAVAAADLNGPADLRPVDCVVEDRSHPELDATATVRDRVEAADRRGGADRPGVVHERGDGARGRGDGESTVYVPVVPADDWEHAARRLAGANVVPVPRPPADQFAILGGVVWATVRRRRPPAVGRRRLRTLLWDLVDRLVEAPTERAMVELTCDRLADTPQFDGAWVCGRPPDPDRRAVAGVDPDRVDDVCEAFEAAGRDPPWVRAATDGTGRVYPGDGGRRDGRDRRPRDADHDRGSGRDSDVGHDLDLGLDLAIVSVPLVYRGVVYGVLNVLRDDRGAPTPRAVLDSLVEFGRVAGQALAATEMQVQRETVRQAIEQAEPAVAILDEDAVVEYVNAAFESVYGHRKSEAIGSTIELLLSEDTDPAAVVEAVREGDPWREEVVTYDRDDRRVYADLSVAAVPVEGGTRRKYVAVVSDVTTLKQREQRLEVLNRVLRHNLRNDLTTVIGNAQLVAEATDDHGDRCREIRRTAEELVATSEKAREVEELVASYRGAETAPLSAVVSDAVSAVRDAHPDCAVEVDLPDADPAVDGRVLPSVLRELVENGVEHADRSTPRVTVGATVQNRDRRPIRVRVDDDGPGIPDHELVPIRRGTETDLEHGSGLGLWLVRWGVRTVNGRVEFVDREPRGTSVRIRLPARD